MTRFLVFWVGAQGFSMLWEMSHHQEMVLKRLTPVEISSQNKSSPTERQSPDSLVASLWDANSQVETKKTTKRMEVGSVNCQNRVESSCTL
jgi:hypothetical protein